MAYYLKGSIIDMNKAKRVAWHKHLTKAKKKKEKQRLAQKANSPVNTATTRR
jgi:hypothetical protein